MNEKMNIKVEKLHREDDQLKEHSKDVKYDSEEAVQSIRDYEHVKMIFKKLHLELIPLRLIYFLYSCTGTYRGGAYSTGLLRGGLE